MTEEINQQEKQEREQEQESLILVNSQEELEELIAFRQTLNFKKPILTYVLMGLTALVFLLQTLLGGSQDTLTLIQLGAKFNPLILAGDWWRFLTPMFLHIGFEHLAVNMISLYMFGTLTERIYGRWRFFIIYFLAGIAGTAASFLFTYNLSAGASGAIFGLVGAQLFFAVQRPRMFKRMFGPGLYVMVAINLAFGFMTPGIDNAGHLGGLAGGFLVASMLQMPGIKRRLQQGIAVFGVLLLLNGLLHFGYRQPFTEGNYQLSLAVASQWLEEEKYVEAERILNQALKWDGNLSDAHTLLGYMNLKKGRVDAAKSRLTQAVALDEKNDLAFFNLGCAYWMAGDNVNAQLYVQKAIELNPDEEHYQKVLTKIEQGERSNEDDL